jgi:Leucine-rich repeat (LRR) protein
VPAVVCTGTSSNLAQSDCSNWALTVRSSVYFAKASPPACQEVSHLSDPCSCTGVIGCSGGRITSVTLKSQGLACNASDDSSLGLLDGLQQISLHLTRGVTGPVPKWLLNLTSLKYVDFWNNQLTGTIPAGLGTLTGLTKLDFQDNKLTGTVPTELGALTDLNSLALGGNQLTGTLPADLGALTGLTYLYFSDSQLTGTLPALPFKQYTANCCLVDCNFSCPLPADAAACICNGKPGVACH